MPQAEEVLLEAMIGVLSAMAFLSVAAVRALWKRLFAGEIMDVLALGVGLRENGQKSARGYEDFARQDERFEGAGYQVDGAAAFREAVALMKGIVADLEKRWPRFDEADLDAALERSTRGEYADLSNLYREFPALQNP